MNYPGHGSPRSSERNGGRGGDGAAWELGSDTEPAFGGSVCRFDHLPVGEPGDDEVPLALLRGEPGLHLAPGAEDHNHHLALDPCLSDDNYDFSSAESGSSLRYYSEGESGGGGSSSSLHPPQQPLVPSNSGGGGAAGGGPGERKRTRPGGAAARHRYEVVTELGPEEVRWFYKEDKKTWKPFIGYDSLRIELAFRTLLQATGARARAPQQPPRRRNVTTVEHRIEVSRELGGHVRHGAGFLPVCGHPFAPLGLCMRNAVHSSSPRGMATQ